MKENTKKWLILGTWWLASISTGLTALYTDHPIAWFWGGVAYLRFYYLVWTRPVRGFEEFSMSPAAIWVNASFTLLIVTFAVPSPWASMPAIMSLALMIYEIVWGEKEQSE